MRIKFVQSMELSSECSVVPVQKALKIMGSSKNHINSLGKYFKNASKAAFFNGEKNTHFSIYALEGTNINHLFAFGVGDLSDFDAELFGANICKKLMMKEKSITLHLDGLDLSPDSIARVVVGMRLASYKFDKYKTKLADNTKIKLNDITIACDEPKLSKASYNAYHGPVCDGTIKARDLVNEPPNVIYPKAYASEIKKLEKYGLKVEILGEKKMKSLGMNSLLCVGQGSARESQMVIIRWNGAKKGEQPICIIGKGVTFDTGGISLKPGANMWDMKGDMGGSAAVVGAMIGLAGRKAKVNVVGIVGLVENMPDGNSVLPGDIITSMSGKTIEVQNTDAEGRLVLADCLHYASEKIKPKSMINLATLTGAILVALGTEKAGVFSNNDELAGQIKDASETTKEYTWRLPLGKEYDRLLDTPNADMKNIGGRLAGSITAAQFLQRFVGKDIPWAHIDVAGTAMKPSNRHDPRETTFGTGFGARLLNRWIADNFEH